MLRSEEGKMQSAARLCGLTIGLSMVIASLGLAVPHNTQSAYAVSASSPDAPIGTSVTKASREAYTRAMLIGYAAAEQGDYHTALINFRRALAARPGDKYALAAIDNMQTYIAQARAEARKQAEIARLQDMLSRAVQNSDWACAANSVERLVRLVPPDSVDRDRLIAYRGEIGGLIESRANLEQWSTVCLGGSP
jgi:tetratricopeptide (TPR) repeat protein